MSSSQKPYIPLRSPTPPLDSSSDELNELSLDQELAQMEQPHFLDYTQIGIPYPASSSDQPPPIPPRHPLTNSLPLNRRSSIPVKMIRSADNVPTYDVPPNTGGKKHFLDENPVRPDYDYRPPRSFDREPERKEHRSGSQPDGHHHRHSIDAHVPHVPHKSKKVKEPSYTLSRYLDNDDGLHPYNDNAVQLNEVNLTPNPAASQFNQSVDDYAVLSLIGLANPVEVSKKFLDLSKVPNTCAILRQSHAITLLVQMIHCGGTDESDISKQQAREALRNVVNFNPDDKVGRREVKVLRYIEQIMDYCIMLKKFKDGCSSSEMRTYDSDNRPLQAMSSLMKISFDEEHRHSMCTLGALQTIANLVHLDHAVHGIKSDDPNCISLRRYAGMALTNLTFGDGNNKALLCANHDFMKALVAQINTDADDLLQVTANVLRNLSWRADNNMKTVLNEIGTVTALTVAAMKNQCENTLRAILSALWNLSAHCSKNKAEFCMVDGALLFLVKMLTYESPSKTLAIIENAGGILRNVSSHIAVNEDFRKILRQGNCLGILLHQLKSESLTIVSNACGTLWNLSARCPEDQKFLWDNGAVPMLRSLIHSKHKMISNGSRIALKNLVNFRPGEMNRSGLDPVAKMMGLKELPTLSARKHRALVEELDQNISETCENETIKTPPPHQKAPKSFNALERDQRYMERSFGHLSLQSESSERTVKPAADFWPSKPFPRNSTNDFETTPAQHPTGTIPKRTMQVDMAEPTATTTVANDTDQITNFSLRYSENHQTQKNRTFSVAEEDTIKCYDNEGTPLLSTATSISDLRPKHPIPHNLHRNLKSGRTTTENSGINTPEKPIYYCEEGTPAYFSRRDSFSSLHEEAEFTSDNIVPTHKPNQLNLLPAHNHNAPPQPNEQISTVPSTPGECGSKTVTFNEFALETPMMFSRHSSLGSLASHEPPLNDDIGSVVSETSRMPSGIISPSEIPDSPSQTMPTSPRQKRHNTNENASNARRLPFEDEVRTFGVENTPALISCATSLSNLSMDDEPKIANESKLPRQKHIATNENAPNSRQFEDEVRTFGVENTPALISCATSLSNLSLDDEPKIANDLLIKEMRLMHHLSDEQDDEQIATTSDAQNEATETFTAEQPEDGDAGEALSDSDDSLQDDASLLKNCISMGIQSKNIEPDIKSPPALPEPSDILLNDSSSDEDLDGSPADLLEQCIQTGITKNTSKPENSGSKLPSGLPRVPAQRMIIKENPIGMLRKGGNSFIETNYDQPNRFHVEESPCNFSVASGLSDLTVGSHTVGLLKTNKLPIVQSNANEKVDENLHGNRSLSPLSVDSEEDRKLLDQAFIIGQAKVIERHSEQVSNATSSQSSSALTVQNVAAHKNASKTTEKADYADSNCSISSIDSNDSNTLLQQCIQAGMSKVTSSKPKMIPSSKSPPKMVTATVAAAPYQIRKSQLPTPKASTSSTSYHRSRSAKREQDDRQLLLECINAGIESRVRSKSTVNEKPTAQQQRSTSQRIDMNEQQMMPSKNVQTTSATVYRTVGATDVVMDKQNGTDFEQDQHQLDGNININSINNINRSTSNSNSISNTINSINNININSSNSNISNSNSNSNNCAQTSNMMNNHVENTIHINDDIIEITAITAQIETGYNISSLNTSMMSAKSQNSFNMGGEMSLLERSNEYPALLGQNESIYDSEHSSSVDMEVSNECLFEHLSPPKMDKHKDPNLMLQSVERLTQELVSTAEYLRTANSLDDDITITESKHTFSVSNNTWNEDTNPNAVDFPKMSKEAPVIESMNDDDTTVSELNGSRYEMANSELIEHSWPHKSNDSNFGLRFEIGGKVNQNSGSFNSNGFDSHSTTSTMTNSTIIAIEANKIRNQLMKDNKTDSMISLDKIRPPSVMDKMNNSSYCDSLTGASSLNRSPARFLSQGFMARRALQTNGNNNILGSNDSINSSLNLDKVKPPSIMDDLLDSMISVDSIASEFVDNVQPNEEPSNYETAFSECDDMTQTLRNCTDLPLDGNNSTPCGSDFSSVESTPKKGRRSLTPRRKRQLTKERYQTYTISTNETQQNQVNANDAQIGVFQMQLSNHTLLMNGNDSDSISLVSSDGEMSSIRAFTKNLPYLQDISIHDDVNCCANDISINTNTYTKLPRGSIQNSLQSTPMPSGDFYDSLPIDNGHSSNASSQTASPNRTITKSPRIVKPSPAGSVEKLESPSQPEEAKGIRGRKKPAYVSPYSMSKLNKATPVTPPKVPAKVVTPKSEPKTPKVEPITKTPTKSPPSKSPPSTTVTKTPTVTKTVESKAKSFIQRSAESLKKMRPTFTSKLSKTPTKKELERQQSAESTKSSDDKTLVRQGTFIKEEPSEGEIPVIVSEPTSPKKTKTLVSRIPFTRTTSLQQSGRNVTKSNTNIEIPLQKNASSTFIRRTMKSASSTSQISSSSSRGSLSPRQSLDSPSTSKSIFNRWTPPNKKVSPVPTTATKLSATKLPNRGESIGTPKPAAKTGIKIMPNSPGKASKIATPRTISTNGRTMKV